MERYARFLLVFIIAWPLLACQKSTVKQNTDPYLTGPDGVSTQYIQDLLHQAHEVSPLKKTDVLLTAIEALLEAQSYDWARSLAEEFPVTLLDLLPAHAPERGRWALINSRLENAAGNTPLALQYLSTQSLIDQMRFYPQELTDEMRQLRAELLFNLGDYIGAVDERIKLSPALEGDEAAASINQELLWQTLMELPLSELQMQSKNATTRAHAGWYSLAAISKNNQNNMREQLSQMDSWQRQYPEHPASLSLPADLQLLRELVANQPKQIAVLLPESGRLKSAADAIRDGLLAAFYHYKTLEPTPPMIRFYDTERGDINEIYNAAVQNGAGLIIGPLAKDKIVGLSNQLNLPVPTLALNTVDSPLGYIGNLYQFGLAVEDEAMLAAQKAWNAGHRRILIIAPNNLWGDRCASTFANEWRALGGEYVRDYRFDEKNDYSAVIQKAFQIDQSQERAKRLQALIGRFEFEPRRRSDIDAIFVAASAPQARQIKPTLAFHYAGDIPVYATGNVYEGENNTKLDQDMNGILFSTLPWFFNSHLPEKRALLGNKNANSKMQPLYALGVDSFYLYPRLTQLKSIKGSRFYGQTGALELAPSGQILRKQVWAEFVNGKAKQIKIAD